MATTLEAPFLSLDAHEPPARSHWRPHQLFAVSFAGILVGLSVLAILDTGSWPKRKASVFSHFEMASTPKSMPKYVWSGKNRDALRTGASEYPLHSSILKGGPAWSFYPMPHSITRSVPLIDDKMNIYFAVYQEGKNGGGSVRKFSPHGKLLWKYMDSSTVPYIPCLYDGAIYFTNTLGLVTALDMETGDEIWHKSALVEGAEWVGSDSSSMAAGDGLIITAAMQVQARDIPQYGLVGGATVLVALDAKTGEVKWYFQPVSAVYNLLLAIKDGSCVFSTYKGVVYRLDLKTGQQIWKAGPGRRGEAVEEAFSTGGTILGHNGVAYTTSNTKNGGEFGTGFVTAFNFSDGNVLWRSSTDYAANNGAAIGEINGRLALAIGIGDNPEMPNPIQQMIGTPDNASTGVLKKNRVVTLDAETGKLIWSYELPPWHGWGAGDTMQDLCLPDAFGNAAFSHDGTVFLGNQNGRLLAIKDEDGNGQISPEEVAEYDTGRCAQGTAAIAPDMLAFIPCDGLLVFKGSS